MLKMKSEKIPENLLFNSLTMNSCKYKKKQHLNITPSYNNPSEKLHSIQKKSKQISRKKKRKTKPFKN